MACAIPDPSTDSVVVTGGFWESTMVTRYGWDGWMRWLEDLPPLLSGRGSHACSSFVSSERLVSISNLIF